MPCLFLDKRMSAHDQTYNKVCTTSEDSDHSAHPRSLIRIFAEHISLLLTPPGYPKRDKRGPLLNRVDIQAGLNLCWSYRTYSRFCLALTLSQSAFYVNLYRAVIGPSG